MGKLAMELKKSVLSVNSLIALGVKSSGHRSADTKDAQAHQTKGEAKQTLFSE